MRKAFTMIELMVTILIMAIFMQILFKFFHNAITEINYLQASIKLSQKSFRAMESLTKGVYKDTNPSSFDKHIAGFVTLDSSSTIYSDLVDEFVIGENKFVSHYGNSITYKINENNLTINRNTKSYTFPNLYCDDLKIEAIRGSNLYRISFKASQNYISGLGEDNISYESYSRLVYVQ